MYTEGFDNWYKFNKNFSQPMSELTEISKRISEQNLELLEGIFARLSNQLKRLSSIKKPEDLINLQKDCLSENIAAGIETTQKIMHMTMENMEDLTKVWRSTATKVSEKAVEKAQKFAHKAERAER